MRKTRRIVRGVVLLCNYTASRTKKYQPHLDALTGIVWLDDSQIVEAHVFKGYDKANPRIEISIEVIAQ